MSLREAESLHPSFPLSENLNSPSLLTSNPSTSPLQKTIFHPRPLAIFLIPSPSLLLVKTRRGTNPNPVKTPDPKLSPDAAKFRNMSLCARNPPNMMGTATYRLPPGLPVSPPRGQTTDAGAQSSLDIATSVLRGRGFLQWEDVGNKGLANPAQKIHRTALQDSIGGLLSGTAEGFNALKGRMPRRGEELSQSKGIARRVQNADCLFGGNLRPGPLSASGILRWV